MLWVVHCLDIINFFFFFLNKFLKHLSSVSNLWEMVKDTEAWRAVVHGVAKSRTQVSDWTEFSVDVTYQMLAWEFSSNWWPRYPGCFCFGMMLLVWQGRQIIWGRFLNGNVPHQFHDIPLAVYQLHHPF